MFTIQGNQKMKSIFKLSALAISTTLLIVACGGSGDSNKNSSGDSNGSGNSNNGELTNTVSTNHMGGIVYTINHDTGKSGYSSVKNDDLNKAPNLSATDSINVSDANGSNRDFIHIKNAHVSTDKTLKFSRFGTVSGENPSYDIDYSKGTLTTNMPVAGELSYKGAMLCGYDTDKVVDPLVVNITVNLATQKLHGTIAGNEPCSGEFDANITNNKFVSASGVAARVEGRFYGNAAAEIGGVIIAGQYGGPFGAKLQ